VNVNVNVNVNVPVHAGAEKALSMIGEVCSMGRPAWFGSSWMTDSGEK
jgi:hypothetical protein